VDFKTNEFEIKKPSKPKLEQAFYSQTIKVPKAKGVSLLDNH